MFLISSNEITASWSASGSESSWNVAIFPSDSTYSDDLLITNLTDTFYTFNNLSTNTDYTIYVQSDCGSEQSAFVQVNGKTLCDAIDSLPTQRPVQSSQQNIRIHQSGHPANRFQSA